MYCFHILPAAQLVYGDHLGRHGPQQDHHSQGLGAAVQHIRAHSHIVLGSSLETSRDLASLVHNAHTSACSPAAAV